MGTSTSLLRKEPINVMYYDNGCSLAPYVQSVLGLGSGSASTSDQWLITLEPNSVNYLGTFLNKVFVKVIPNITNHADPYFDNMLRNLQREVKIYAEVIKPILDKRISPYFLPVLNVSNNCTGTSVVNMLMGKAPQVGYTRKVPDTYPTETFSAEKVLIRNMVISTMSFEDGDNVTPGALCFDEQAEIDHVNSFPDQTKQVNNVGFLKSFTTGENIVSLHSPENKECVSKNRAKFLFETTYTMLYTVPIEGGETGASLINSLLASNNFEGLYFYFFQLFIGLATMSWSKVYHNDLHENNVLIQFLPKKEKFTYMVGFNVYTFSTNMIPIIFDFDRSVVAKFDTVTDMNIFYKDIWSMAYVYYTDTSIPKDVQNMFITCLFKPLYHQNVKNHLNNVRSFHPDDPYAFSTGRNALNSNWMAQWTLDFDTIVKNWADAANVSYLSILDPRVVPVLQLKDRKQYVTASYLFDENTGVITASDPFTELFGLIEESVKVDEKVAREVIPKKQALARQNLELLQLKLKLEKIPSRK